MSKDKVVCAVDIGSSKIAALIATVGEDERVNLIGVSSVSSRGVKKSQIVDIEDAVASITESIEAAERMAGYSVSSVFVTMGGPQIQSINSKAVVAVAKPDSEIDENDILRVNDAARAINLPASKEIIHVVPRTFTVDGQEGIKDPIGMTGMRLETETHIVTAASPTMRNLIKCMERVNVNIDELVFSGIASATAVLTETEKELGVVLVDIGGETTDVVIFVDGAIAYSAVIPVGARHITADLAVGLRVSLESAEKIKLYLGKVAKTPALPETHDLESSRQSGMRAGSAAKGKEDLLDPKSIGIPEEIQKISKKAAVDSIMRPRVREIFELVGKELKKSGFAAQTPSGLVICGGGALTVNALDQAKYVLGYPARMGKVEGLGGLTDEIGSPAFAAAAGLILYASQATENDKLNISVLSKGLPIKDVMRKGINLIKSFLP